ncbi:transient receptor potential channel pyrexia [Diorhabda carinulata]|uniref:transient receptor potential channel pyrexia n=1 Tax=Diorhabda carinulata TaxID=1163345 RepID=UPI0025A13CED|nr:transient receptor potential channel pyrexia [Diorhabda carinulata]
MVLSENEEPIFRWENKDIEMQHYSSTISSEDDGSEDNIEERIRTRPYQEIWNASSIWESLMNLPDAEEIYDLLQKNNLQSIIGINKNTGLLMATWLGNIKALELILESMPNLETCDESGRTALHLAAYGGKSDCLNLLLNTDCNINAWDKTKQITPLHCAAGAGDLNCIKILLKKEANVNAGLSSGAYKAPLYFAVQSNATDCVKELLENGAIPNPCQVFSETPLHVAASLGNSEIMKLLLQYGAANDVQCGSEKMTPLHLAVEDGDLECVKLLINVGANVSAKNYKNQTPLHLAALSQCSETIALLLSKGADANAADVDGRTPLHCSIVKASRSCECVRILLGARPNVNKPDIFGYTPLHLAALNEYSHCVMLLINNGGDVTARTNGGISVLTFITRKTPGVIHKYIMKFDNSIKVVDHEIGDIDCELKLDFRVLVPTVGNKETELLLNFIEVGHKEVLKHPLCETFLFLKWRRIRKFFLFSLFFHSLFAILFTFYTIGVFLKNCPSSKSFKNPCWVPEYVKIFGYNLLILTLLLLAKELFQIAHSWQTYIKQWENALQWLIIFGVFCCVQPTTNMDIRQDVFSWQHHVAAICIFITWVELMMIVGRFPMFGLYIQMFTTVAVNYAKFMMAYICLFLAFALSFGVIFANYPAFQDLKWVFLKVIIMMSGELEYEDVFFPEEEKYRIRYPYTAHLMYLGFVILVTIILTNLIVGLAVSDIQELQRSAGLDRLVRQAELVAHLESMLFSKLLSCVPKKIMKFLHNNALLLRSQYHWALYIRPNDPREERIPKDLVKNIYQIVVSKKDKPKKPKKMNDYYYYDIISPSLSRLNSYTSETAKNSSKNQLTTLKEQVDDISRDFYEQNRILKHKIDKIYLTLNGPK